MRLLRMDAGVATAGEVRLRLRLPGVLNDGDELQVNVHASVESVEEFLSTTVDEALGETLATRTFEVSELEPDQNGEVDLGLFVGEDSVGQDSDSEGASTPQDTLGEPIRLVDAGVYPLSVELRTQDDQLAARLVTHLIKSHSADGSAEVLGESANTPEQPASEESLDVLLVANLGGSAADPEQFSDWLSVLGRHLDVPVLVTVFPSRLTEADAEAAAQALAEAVSTSDKPVRALLVRSAYYPVDLATLSEASLFAEIEGLWERGATALSQYGTLADPALWVEQGPTAEPDEPGERSQAADHDRASERQLRARFAQGVNRVVLSQNSVQAVPGQTASSQGNLTQAAYQPVQLIAGDASPATALLAEQLAQPQTIDAPGAAAQRVLAHLATIALFAENNGSPNGTSRNNSDAVVAVDLTAAGYTPQLAELILAALDRLELLRPVAAEQAFAKPIARNADGTPLVVQPLPGLAENSAVINPDAGPGTELPADFFETRQQLASYRSMIRDEDTQPYHQMVEELLATLSIEATPDQQSSTWQMIDNFVKLEVNKLEATSSSSVRLTSRSALVPFSFLNESEIPLRVEFRLLSDKLTVNDFDDGETTTLVLPPGVTTHEFDLSTLVSGSFLVSMELHSPDGILQISSTPIVMQSTAPTWAGFLLATGAALFLLLWWVMDSRRRRRLRMGA